jgi:hypothetical protein
MSSSSGPRASRAPREHEHERAGRARSRRHAFLLAIVNLAAVVVAIGAFELWRRNQSPPGSDLRLEGTIAQGFYDTEDDVGYLPRANMKVTARKMEGDTPIYDVTYTIGPDRFRVVPRAEAKEAKACILLFGDSHTFGEGVNDNETYAWQLAGKSGGRIAVHDFGMSGWGPHQMLAGLQSGRFPAATTCTPTDVVYHLIPDHIGRVAGRSKWDPHGPRFRLGADGRPVRDGNFDSPGPKAPAPDLDEGILGWRRLFDVRQVGTREEAKLLAAILVDSARELQKRYPGVRVHVLDWDPYDNARIAEILPTLKAAGLVVHPIDAIIPDYRQDWQRYAIHRLDRHPNPEAHRRIADYIAREIVKGR